MEDASRGINDESIGDTFNRILEENGCAVNSKEVFIFEDLIFDDLSLMILVLAIIVTITTLTWVSRNKPDINIIFSSK